MQMLTVLALITMASVSVASDTFSDEEQRMVDWIDAHTEEAIALIKETVDIPSGSLNKTGVRAVGEVLRRELDGLGLSTEWIDMPVKVDRAGHLFGRKEGVGKKILMIGHLDTVFEIADGLNPFERDGDIARGHGIYDMKTGNVVMIYALRALQEIGALDDIPVIVAYTGDEEKSGRPLSVSRKHLIEAGHWADIALGFEEAKFDDNIDWATIARRSSSRWKLTVEGKQAHSAGIFNEKIGAGAIFEAARILNAFYEDVRGEEFLTFNAGTIMGGTEISFESGNSTGTTFGKTNVVPKIVIVRGGMRTLSQAQLARARTAMEFIVAQNHPMTTASIEFQDSYPPMAPTAGNIALAATLSEINVALGRKPMQHLDPSRRGAADISFVAPYTDALAGLGAIGGGGHTPDEYLRLSSLPLAIKRAAILIYRLHRDVPAD